MPHCSFEKLISVFTARYTPETTFGLETGDKTLRPVGEHNYMTYIHEAGQNVEQTRYPVYNVGVYRAENSVVANEAGLSRVGRRTE